MIVHVILLGFETVKDVSFKNRNYLMIYVRYIVPCWALAVVGSLSAEGSA